MKKISCSLIILLLSSQFIFNGCEYDAKVSHFSVFNMDEEFDAGEAACLKLCSTVAPGGATIEITGDIPGNIKTLLFGTSICGGTGGCAAGETAYVINNLKANTPISVRLFDGANIRGTFVFISGGPGNETDCSDNYGDCTSSQQLNWGVPCYQNTDAVGSVDGPVVALQPSGGTNFKVAWVYVDTGATGSPLANPSTNYKVEYLEITNQNAPSVNFTDAAWTDAVGGTISNTSIKNSLTVSIPPASGTNPVLVRVSAFPMGASNVLSGTIRILNLSAITPLSQFETDYATIQSTCDNVGQVINP